MTTSTGSHTVLVYLNHLEIGGTQLNALDFASTLRDRGIESVLVGARDTVPSIGPSVVDLATERGIQIELFDDAGNLRSNAKTIKAIAHRRAIDLVHVYGSWGGGAGATYWGPAIFGRIPWVHTVYEMSVPDLVKHHMPLIVGTGYQIDEQADRRGSTAMISPPVDMVADSPQFPGGDAFRRQHGAGDALLLVIVSRLDPNMKAYSIGIAIEAMRTLAHSGAQLVIIGDGPAAADLALRAAAVNREVGRRVVTLAGALLDPRPAYAAADIMLGMGGSAARSLAFGKPLVVQGEAGWSQLFEPSSAEMLARSSYWSPDAVPDPVERLVREILPVFDDPGRRKELGRFGREFAVDRFGLAAMADRLEQVYTDAWREYGWRQWFADLPSEGSRVARRIRRAFAGEARGGARG